MALIVADSATYLAPGQMKKREFLTLLRTAVCRAADEAMAGTGRDTRGCPYLATWFEHYDRQDSRHLERAIHRYAPESANATTADEYIPLVAVRVRQGLTNGATTGAITGVPEGLPANLAGIGLMGGLGSPFAGIGRLFFKAREGGASKAADPVTIRSQLGDGRPLDSAVRKRMELALGTSFSHVRTHTNATAIALSRDLNARAFTVGAHVAFGAGEYRPGTPAGDALIAHELAHVMQQRGASENPAPIQRADQVDHALERDADETAVDAAMSLWGHMTGAGALLTQNVIPRIRTGLRLQRCATGPQRREVLPEPIPARQAASTACTRDERQSMERINQCCTAPMLREIGVLRAQALPILEGTVQLLSSSPRRVRDPLWEHFRIRSNDSVRLPRVLQQFRSMLRAMRGDETVFICRDKDEDPLCSGKHAQTIPTCTGRGPFYLHFCGHYASAAHAGGGRYLPEDHWLKTFIHEYAHIGCTAATPIYPANQEFYRQANGTYPRPDPDERIQNADCYAWFAMAVRNPATTANRQQQAQSKSRANETDDRYEREADRIAEAVVRLPVAASSRPASGHAQPQEEDRAFSLVRQSWILSPASTRIQRQPQSEETPPVHLEIPEQASEATISTERGGSTTLIVEDSASELAPGQMRRKDFLTRLRTAVCRAADEAMAGTGRSTDDCPYLDRWFDYYRERDSEHIERAIHRYAPETIGVRTAQGYIPPVVARVRRSVESWARTGEITGVPEEMLGTAGIGLGGIAGGFLGGIVGLGAGLVRGVGRLATGIGGILAKHHGHTPPETGDPRAIETELGTGRPLDSQLRMRMESALDTDFAAVRFHIDSRAAALAESLDARAFTVGEHVAFGTGEYQPGTPVGDALIAHELAHTVQQGGASTSTVPKSSEGARDRALEEAADLSAATAVVSLWGGEEEVPTRATQETPLRLRAGLRLQRCAAAGRQVRREPRTLSDFAAMTPWELTQVAESEFERAELGRQPASAPRAEDYRRAARLAEAVLDFDIDTPPGPGSDVTDSRELRALDTNLSQLLSSISLPGFRVRQGRELPTDARTGRPTLRGRVRKVTRKAMAAARYRLELTVAGFNPNSSEVISRVEGLLGAKQIPISPSRRITNQEARILIYHDLTLAPQLANGLYQVQEDRIYIPDFVDLTTPQGSFLARHETAHLLGGAERTRQAFMRRFGPHWLDWWQPVEEGMTELIARESLPAGQAPPSAPSFTTPAGVTVEGIDYAEWVAWMRTIMANRENRELMLRAYFTGNVPEQVFALLAQVRGVPLPPLPSR